MGKKKVSVAIAESSIVEDPQQQQKRKRGRPRKIVENIEEIKTAAGAAEYEDALEGQSKKAETIKGGGGEEEEKKEELQSGETQVSKQQPPRRSSRARRKSKPRKSS